MEVTYGKYMLAKMLRATCVEHNFRLNVSHFKVFVPPNFNEAFAVVKIICFICNKEFPTYSIACLYRSILQVFIRGSNS